MQRMTSTAWFGPKRYAGWGWRPTSWQGWAFTVAWAVVVVAVSVALAGSFPVLMLFLIGAGAVFLLVTVLTGDPPGGPRIGR